MNSLRQDSFTFHFSDVFVRARVSLSGALPVLVLLLMMMLWMLLLPEM